MNFFSKLLLCSLICIGFSFQSVHASPARRTGVINVGLDNGQNPIQYAYVTQGHNDGRPVIVFADPYFGIEGWRCLQEKLSEDFYTVAFDVLGSGLSSKNDPLLMDGVVGQIGYSHRQHANFTHTLLKSLNLKGPITFVAVDTQAQPGMWYAVDFANQPFALSKLVLIGASMYAVVSDDPCILGFLTEEQAVGLTQYYAADPCAALNVLLANSFITTDCPEAETIQLKAAVKFSSTVPANIFTRNIMQTYKESIYHLMPLINIPVLALYGSTGDLHSNSRRATAATFVPFCPSCPGFNAYVPGVCQCGSTSTVPFSDVRLLTYPGHGTCLQVSAFKRFYKDLKKFVLGKDSACSLCPLNFHSPNTCPDPS